MSLRRCPCMYGFRLARGTTALAMSIVARRKRASLVVARVIDNQNSAAGVHEFSISFLCRPKQYTDMLRLQLSLLGEEYDMSSTPETGRLACTSAVARFNAARRSVPI